LLVPGESIQTVAPLAVPDPQAPVPVGAGVRYAGLTLFAERAAAIQSEFAITADNIGLVARICHPAGRYPAGDRVGRRAAAGAVTGGDRRAAG
jgi:predicted ATPase